MSGQHITSVFGSALTVTLPAPFPNARVKVTNFGTGGSTVSQHASEVIYGWGMGAGGATSFPLGAYGATATVESDGVNWFVTAGMQDSGWLAVGNGSMTNSWVNGSPAFGYRLQGNVVRLRGVLTTGGSGINALTLPAGYRPATAINAPASVVGFANAAATITTGGVLQPAYASAGSGWSADGITFTVD